MENVCTYLYCGHMMQRHFLDLEDLEVDHYRACIQNLQSTTKQQQIESVCRLKSVLRKRDTCPLIHHLSVVEVKQRFQGVCQSTRCTADLFFADLPSVGALIHVQIAQTVTLHFGQFV